MSFVWPTHQPRSQLDSLDAVIWLQCGRDPVEDCEAVMDALGPLRSGTDWRNVTYLETSNSHWFDMTLRCGVQASVGTWSEDPKETFLRFSVDLQLGDWTRPMSVDPDPVIAAVEAVLSARAPSVLSGCVTRRNDLTCRPTETPSEVLPEPCQRHVNDVWWWTVFGPKWVDAIGRQRVWDAPWASREQHGDVIVGKLWAASDDFLTAEGRATRMKVYRALGGRAPAAAHKRYEQRAREVAPESVDFDPDIDPIVRLLVDGGFGTKAVPALVDPLRSLQLLNERIRGWNRFRAPAVVERTTPSTAEPLVPPKAGLPDDDGIVVYEMIRPPYVGEPRSLPLIDYWIWYHLFWHGTKEAIHERQSKIVEEVGLYLGRMAEQRLGGQWACRRRLEDCSLEVGGVHWLPFARVQHMLVDTDSVLAHSLTKFWCEMARAAGRPTGIEPGWPIAESGPRHSKRRTRRQR